MPLTPTETAPTELIAGDAYAWPVAAVGYITGYTAKVRYIGTATSIEGTATAQGTTEWLITISPALSATLPSGSVRWELVVTEGTTDRRTLASGQFRVIGVPDIGAGQTSISEAAETLAKLRKLANQQAGDLLYEYEIGGTRRVKKYTMDELRKAISYWSAVVAAENRGGSFTRTYSVQF